MEPKRKNTSKHVQVCHFISFCHTVYHDTAFSESKGRATVTMNHTRETGTRLRVDRIKILALDGTGRTKQTKYHQVTHSKQWLTITAQKLEATGAATSCPNSSHQGNIATKELFWKSHEK